MSTLKNSLVKRLLEQLPPEELYTFSDRQVAALYKSEQSLPRKSHAMHIRWSVPFPGKGFYLVIFAGRERRSRQRLLTDKEFQVLPRILLVSVMLCGCITLLGLVYGQRMISAAKQRSAFELETSDNSVHPTVVPFKYDREQCENSHREWKEGQCVDYEHDHTF